jgi:hypothetical protein
MPVKKFYSYEMTERAISRAMGHNLKKFRKGIVEAVNTRVYSAKGKGVGHTYLHRRSRAPDHKSRYLSAFVAISVTREMLNSAEGQTKLGWLDLNPGKQATIRRQPIKGDWYGYKRASDDKFQVQQKILTATCQLFSSGDYLWVHTSYPEHFAGEMDYGLDALFNPEEPEDLGISSIFKP